jgi:nicotinamidase-related amidase
MPGYAEAMRRAIPLVAEARRGGIPVVFTQERHSRTMVDFGRELDGSESVHCLEDDPKTALPPDLSPQPDEYLVPKRRYSAFFGTDLEILLRGLGTRTIVLCGGMTDVCVHYTFVDAHQHDYHVRVVTDAVAGSSQAAHEAALRAMKYLQRDALTTSKAVSDAFRCHENVARLPGGGARPDS